MRDIQGKKNMMDETLFSEDQLEQIHLGRQEGIAVEKYAFPELMALQMYHIREGLKENLPVELYAAPEYDWFQMEEIREGLKEGIDVKIYAQPDIPYQNMRQLRQALKDGLDLSLYKKLPAGILQQLREALVAKVNIIPYIKERYDSEQLNEIRLAMINGVDISPYLVKEMRGIAIREIRLGLEQNLDVSEYADIYYNWQQMREIRLGLESRVNVEKYNNPLYSFGQMREIRIGLEKGLPVESYKSFVYTAAEMAKRREELEKSLAEYEENQDEKARITLASMEEDYQLELSGDEMDAFLTINSREGKPYTVEELHSILERNGIIYGIVEKALQDLTKPENIGNMIWVAHGTLPKYGEDGRYEYFFRKDMKKTPVMLEDGSVNYQDVEWFEMVEEGQKLVVYHKASEGAVGRTVTGAEILARNGEEQKRIHGRGFTVSEDGLTYIAAKTGRITYDEEKMEMIISAVCVVDEVTTATGNLDFNGSVYVKGDVGSGTKITAIGDVVVEGNVEAAYIKSGGNVLIKRGAAAAGNGVIDAEGDVSGKFFEMIVVRSGRNISANYCLNCELYAEGSINITGTKGSLAGGSAQAMRNIEVYNLGNKSGLVSNVILGNAERMQQTREVVKAKIEQAKKEQDSFIHARTDMQAKYPPEIRNTMELYLKIEAAIYTKQKQIDELKLQMEAIDIKMRQVNSAAVIIKGVVYEGVTVQIGNAKWRARMMRNITIKKAGARLTIYNN